MPAMRVIGRHVPLCQTSSMYRALYNQEEHLLVCVLRIIWRTTHLHAHACTFPDCRWQCSCITLPYLLRSLRIMHFSFEIFFTLNLFRLPFNFLPFYVSVFPYCSVWLFYCFYIICTLIVYRLVYVYNHSDKQVLMLIVGHC